MSPARSMCCYRKGVVSGSNAKTLFVKCQWVSPHDPACHPYLVCVCAQPQLCQWESNKVAELNSSQSATGEPVPHRHLPILLPLTLPLRSLTSKNKVTPWLLITCRQHQSYYLGSLVCDLTLSSTVWCVLLRLGPRRQRLWILRRYCERRRAWCCLAVRIKSAILLQNRWLHLELFMFNKKQECGDDNILTRHWAINCWCKFLSWSSLKKKKNVSCFLFIWLK